MTAALTPSAPPAGANAAPAASPQALGLAVMHPAYFAMVMATGIVSIASALMGWRQLGAILFWLNAGLYILLWSLLLIRCIRFPRNVRTDLLHHGRCVGFFTIVAATCVLGSQCLLMNAPRALAAGLWWFGVALWVVLTYGIVTLLTVKDKKPGLAEGINGGWLLLVVAPQSVAVLGAQLAAPAMGDRHSAMLLFCLILWLGAGMLYIWVISLIFYRYTFFQLSPDDLAPPYWINMGAVAISTLAGTMLLANAPQSALVTELSPFIKGLTLFFWATATWWIPMLVILGAWRHLYQRFPLRYDPLYWGAVFPLGMYTACTHRLTQVMDAELLVWIPKVFVYIALAAWLVTLIGFARRVLSTRTV